MLNSGLLGCAAGLVGWLADGRRPAAVPAAVLAAVRAVPVGVRAAAVPVPVEVKVPLSRAARGSSILGRGGRSALADRPR